MGACLTLIARIQLSVEVSHSFTPSRGATVLRDVRCHLGVMISVGMLDDGSDVEAIKHWLHPMLKSKARCVRPSKTTRRAHSDGGERYPVVWR